MRLIDNLPDNWPDVARLAIRQVLKSQAGYLKTARQRSKEQKMVLDDLYQAVLRKWKTLPENVRQTALSVDDLAALFQLGELIRTNWSGDHRQIKLLYEEVGAGAVGELIKDTASENILAALNNFMEEGCPFAIGVLLGVKPTLLGRSGSEDRPLWARLMGETFDKGVVHRLEEAVYGEERQKFIQDVVANFGTKAFAEFDINPNEPESIKLREMEWERRFSQVKAELDNLTGKDLADKLIKKLDAVIPDPEFEEAYLSKFHCWVKERTLLLLQDESLSVRWKRALLDDETCQQVIFRNPDAERPGLSIKQIEEILVTCELGESLEVLEEYYCDALIIKKLPELIIQAREKMLIKTPEIALQRLLPLSPKLMARSIADRTIRERVWQEAEAWLRGLHSTSNGDPSQVKLSDRAQAVLGSLQQGQAQWRGAVKKLPKTSNARGLNQQFIQELLARV